MDRRSLLETLEQRQLLAVGPQLIGIQPSENSLLLDGSVLETAPQELTFRFDDATEIDPSTLSGIRIIRAGEDGFATSQVASDLGTQGSVYVEFEATQGGQAGEGTRVVVTSANRSDGPAPRVTVSGNEVRVELNRNPSQVTRVSDFLNAMSVDSVTEVVQTRLISGSPVLPIGTELPSGGMTAELISAERAQTVTGLGASGVRVRIAADEPGPQGRGIELDVERFDLGRNALPVVTVNDQTIRVLVNSRAGSETTVDQFVAAVENNPSASRLVDMIVEGGNTGALVGNPGLFGPIALAGEEVQFDDVIEPGFIGLGDSAREVVVRFAERLPQDNYRIEILGSGPNALRNTAGQPLGGGQDTTVRFSLNLAPRVEAVVPQPVVRRTTGQREQLLDEVWVYFDRNDPLDPLAATNSELYRLLATRGTAVGSDDLEFEPTSVTYNSETGVARLRFSHPLDALPGVGGTEAFRLQVGGARATSEPVEIDAREDSQLLGPGETSRDPGDNYTEALDVSADWALAADGTMRSLRINGQISSSELVYYRVDANGDPVDVDEDGNLVPERDDRYRLDLPGGSDAPGHRQIREEDPSRLDRPVPLDHLRQGADDEGGTATVYYNFFSQYFGDDPATRELDNDKRYFNLITEQQKERVREAFDLYSQYLGVQFVETEAMGVQIAVGDLHGGDPNAISSPGGLAVVTGKDLEGGDRPLGVLDSQDFDASDDDLRGGEFFRGAMLLIGQMLGYGYADDLPDITVNSGGAIFGTPGDDPLYPAPADVLHGQHLYRPDSVDIDLYKFSVPSGGGRVTIETLAERLGDVSLLDTQLRLFREAGNGRFEEVAANGDYWSRDSQIEVDLAGGTYYVGVSAAGNDEYDPIISGTGFGGRSEGEYELRMSFRPNTPGELVDETGRALDGDADGEAGGQYNFWFEAADEGRTAFVDKSAAAGGDGSLAAPFRTIREGLDAAGAGNFDAVRILANGGADGRIETPEDNVPYQIGFGGNGRALEDGSSFQVPRGVTVMVDAGAVIKLRRAQMGVGSASPVIDHSGGALQLLGTPILVNSEGGVLPGVSDGSVTLTSLADSSIAGSQAAAQPNAGDWGGVNFQSSIDKADESRVDLEAAGLFLNTVQFADIRYGGGTVVVEGQAESISPIEMNSARPTVAYSRIRESADAAMEATPDSFEETKFGTYAGQAGADYTRVGPDLYGNTVIDNSINGLFIRTRTRDGSGTEKLTVPARMDDVDIVHVLAENLRVEGTPGGPVLEEGGPPILLVRASGAAGGSLATGADTRYAYRITYVDASGNESPASELIGVRQIPDPDGSGETIEDFIELSDGDRSIRLSQLPATPSGGPFVARRVYRATLDADDVQRTVSGEVIAPEDSEFELVEEINASSSSYTDVGRTGGETLNAPPMKLRQRLDARLAFDPGMIVKADGAVIEVEMGAQLLAEGHQDEEITFTSLDDTRFGAGGTFRTNSASDEDDFQAGDWGGFYFAPGSQGSFDHARIVAAGGASRIEGELVGFNAIEVHQAELRLVNSRLEMSDDGESAIGGGRAGRGTHAPAVVFVRGAQPIVVGNTFLSNDAPALSMDVNSLDWQYVADSGRSTGLIGRAYAELDNQGPLVRGNVLEDNTINGLEVRGGELATEGVWDDTDIVHVLRETVSIPNQHVYGGLRLKSAAERSLVVKLEDGDEPAAIVAGGTLTSAADELSDIDDRIGGALQILGQPNHPVILTALADDSIGAGFDRGGRPQVDTNNDGGGSGASSLPTGPEVDNGLLIDNDVPTDVVGHFEAQPAEGGAIGTAVPNSSSGVTAQGATQLFANSNFIFEFLNYIDIGGDGQGVDLATTTITTPPTLVADDLVVSEGEFQGPNGDVRWRVETRLNDGEARVINTVQLDSDQPLGDIRYVNYLDEDVMGFTDDILYPTGTPGEDDFRLFTLDGPERIGFAQGGVYNAGPDLQNATYTGWAADRFADLRTAITGAGSNYSVPGVIDQNDLPPATDPTLGQIYGPNDVTTAMAWDVSPTATSARITTFLELIARDPGIDPGQWTGIVIREGANDRNVDLAIEEEGAGISAGLRNDKTDRPQFLGELAPSISAGSENRPLGFDVNGVLEDADDVDVYSFEAEAGTEVWLDIDRTAVGLDAVLELVDSEGNVLALSDHAVEEQAVRDDRDGQGPAIDSRLSDGTVNPLRKSSVENSPNSAFDSPQDLYSTNAKDPGFRVVLPGDGDAVSTYHVRVRSSNVEVGEESDDGPAAKLLDTTSLVVGAATAYQGLTAGRYELKIRLREVDEAPGTVIRGAEVRYAQTGIKVIGHPMHSPLLGEDAETTDPNDDLASAQPLGPFGVDADGAGSQSNLLRSDRLAKSIAGSLSDADDVDWYRFDVQYDQLTPDGITNYLSTVFDIDYADGYARPDVSLAVYNEAGQLILRSLDSNIAEDQPGDLQGADSNDLSRGSAGTADPFIGNVELTEGTYYVAVSGRDRVPAPMQQYNVANPSDSAHQLVRLEPIESIRRIAEDHIGSSGGSTADAPQTPLLFDFSDPDNDPFVPYSLTDVVLYTNTGNGDVQISNPFTGELYGTVGGYGPDIRDIAFRFNGDMHGYSRPTGGGDADNNWFYQLISSEDGSLTNLTPGGTGLQTVHTEMQVDNNGNITFSVEDSDSGVFVDAITFGEIAGGERGYFVASRGAPPAGTLGVDYIDNIVWRFNPATGVPAGPGVNNAPITQGAGTNIQEVGRIDTSDPQFQLANFLGITAATERNAAGNFVSRIEDGTQFVLQDNGNPNDPGAPANQLIFEFDAGRELQTFSDPTAGQFLRDGDTMTVGGITFEFDAGARLELIGASRPGGIIDGTRVELTDRSGQTYSFEFDDNGVTSSSTDSVTVVPVAFDAENGTAASAASQLAAAIRSVDSSLSAVGASTGEVVLRGLGAEPVARGRGAAVLGEAGIEDSNAVSIVVEEEFSAVDIASAIARVLQEQGISVSTAGNRINFAANPSVAIDLDGPQNVAPALAQTGQPGITSGGQPIPFMVGDSVDQIASRVIAAIDEAVDSGRLFDVTGTSRGHSIQLANAQVLSATDSLVVGGVAPGGTVTGTAVVGGDLYAVSNAGGLYRIGGGAAMGNSFNDDVANYIPTATDLRGINFTALSAGPQFVEDGRYADLMFGITGGGTLYAFNTEGELQPVFAGGRSSIQTGTSGANGLDFSNLDYNLWHVTGRRGGDDGHGINATDNETRDRTAGGSSLYFGFDSNDNMRVPLTNVTDPSSRARADGSAVTGTYNFPGGAHGAMVSNPFSLEGYSSADQPMLYFNYFLETEDANVAGPDDATRMADSVRVYVIDGDGVEHLVSTNNSDRDAGFGDDEFDDPTEAGGRFAGTHDDDIDVAAQELFDNTDTWRQARVPLGEFAGMGDLRLRLEVSTSGSFEFGGPRLQARPGNEIRDGETFTINGRTFEFVTDAIAIMPAGSQIPEGSHIEVDDVRYVFTTDPATVSEPNVAVVYSPTDTAAEVAQALAEAVNDRELVVDDALENRDADESQQDDVLADAQHVALPGPDVTVTSPMMDIGMSGGAGVSADVDLVRVTLDTGQSLEATVRAASIGSSLDAVLRMFDAAGNEILRGTRDAAGDRVIEFTSPSRATYYLGVSGAGNEDYDPNAPSGRSLGTAGEYRLDLVATRPYEIRAASDRVIFEGANEVLIPTDSPVRMEGADGFVGIPVQVNTAMSATEVAAAIREAVAETFNSGNLAALPQNGPVISTGGLRIDDAGPLVESVRWGDAFGDNREHMARANEFEGVYMDDFIIGFAERGEMVTGAIADDSFEVDAGLDRTLPAQPAAQINSGPYQLEIRDGSEYVATADASQFPIRSFDTNDRLANGVTLTPGSADQLQDAMEVLRANPTADNPDGRLTFTLSDGSNTITFEFVDATGNRSAARGNVPVVFDPAQVDAVSGVVEPQSAAEVASELLKAINLPEVRALLGLRALSSSGLGADEAAEAGDRRINLYGDPVIDVSELERAGLPGAFTVERFNHRGDANRERDAQGVVRIENAAVEHSSEYGIVLDHGLGGDDPDTANVVRYPRNLVELNTENLVPGVVVENNLLAYNVAGGIQVLGIGGEASSQSPVPFDRIVNNTIVGGSTRLADGGEPALFDGTLFVDGALSFADTVVDYRPDAGGLAPDPSLRNPDEALGAPDYTAAGEPAAAGDGAVPLGRGGTLTVQFVDNRLTGSGDARPDLQIFEAGLTEAVLVEVSINGRDFTPVGTATGGDNQIDIDRYGFGRNDRVTFVRLTDLSFSEPGDLAAGADIDAVGAINSVPAVLYTAGGVGVDLVDGVSPTLLNNVIVNSEVGIQSDAASDAAVVGATTFQLNDADTQGPVGPGQLARFPGAGEDLFIDPTRNLFVPAQGSDLIDSSINSLEDRPGLVTVKEAIGMRRSPILAPDFDLSGALRTDDPTHEVPGGSGNLVFKERGALERSDVDPPVARFITPQDQGPADQNDNLDQIQLLGATPRFFEIRLIDNGDPDAPTRGVGIDDRSVRSEQILIFQDGEALIEGIDYRFGYDANTDTIRLTPLAGVWEEDSVYTVRLVTASQNLLIGQPGGDYTDGEIFTIADADGTPTTFEIDMGMLLSIPSTVTGLADLADGDAFTVFDGNAVTRFEFETTGGVLPGSQPIAIPDSATPQQVAAAVATAFDDLGIDLTVIDLGDGRIQLLGSNPLAAIDPGQTNLGVEGAVGVSPGFGIRVPSLEGAPDGLQDGQEFSIRRGDGRQETFEITFDGSVADGNRPVFVSAVSSLNQVTDAIVEAIASSGLDLIPEDAGFGVVRLPDAADVSLVLDETVLEQVGRPGDTPAVPVVIEATEENTAEVVAGRLADAVNDAGLSGVTADPLGTRVLVGGAAAVTGTGALLVSAPTDLAGNPLAGDITTGRAEFEIFLSAGRDYGDAPEPRYPSLESSNGPRHEIVAGFSLGPDISADADARPDDGDDDDGVTFLDPDRIFTGFDLLFQVDVVNQDPARDAFIDAWVDFDGDGRFEESGGERILRRTAVAPGTNTISVPVPGDAVNGEVYARFRLSSNGVDSPLGAAPDGEVEDYAITVRSNPFQNPDDSRDVNGDGSVTPIDALQIINVLNRSTSPTIPLDPETDPPGPPYLDVNGSGTVTPLDALLVINRLNSLARAGGEGEAFVAAGAGVLAPATQMDAETSRWEEPVAVLEPEAEPRAMMLEEYDAGHAVYALDPILDDLTDEDDDAERNDSEGVDAYFADLSR